MTVLSCANSELSEFFAVVAPALSVVSAVLHDDCSFVAHFRINVNEFNFSSKFYYCRQIETMFLYLNTSFKYISSFKYCRMKFGRLLFVLNCCQCEAICRTYVICINETNFKELVVMEYFQVNLQFVFKWL